MCVCVPVCMYGTWYVIQRCAAKQRRKCKWEPCMPIRRGVVRRNVWQKQEEKMMKTKFSRPHLNWCMERMDAQQCHAGHIWDSTDVCNTHTCICIDILMHANVMILQHAVTNTFTQIQTFINAEVKSPYIHRYSLLVDGRILIKYWERGRFEIHGTFSTLEHD